MDDSGGGLAEGRYHSDPAGRVARPINGDDASDDLDREARWAAWRAENAEAIASWNTYVDTHGLPLSSFSRP